MRNRLKEIVKNRFRKTNFDAFLFFLIFAVVVWIFVQFSKEYTQIINIPVEYVNIPLDKIITADNPDELELRMENTGFKIAWFSLSPPTFSVDASRAEEMGTQLIYAIEENRVEIQEQLDIDFENTQFLNDTISIHFEQRQEKLLPVFPEINVDFAVGYAAQDSLRLEPDSIMVSGPENILDTLGALQTFVLNLKGVKNNLAGNVAIDSSSLQNVTLYQKTVQYSLDVEKFTEGTVAVPIELINVPEDLNVVIFPKEVMLSYQVNLEDYNKVSASDFRVVCNFNEIEEDQRYLIPKIIQQPIFVNHLRLNENKVQFIIKQ